MKTSIHSPQRNAKPRSSLSAYPSAHRGRLNGRNTHLHPLPLIAPGIGMV